MSEHAYVLLLAVVVGLLSGLAAVALKTLVHYSGVLVTRVGALTPLGGNVMMLVFPLIGIALTVLFVKYIVRGDIGHGLPSVLLAISRNEGRLPAMNMYTSLIASTLTVAFGGSVGLEAPIASTGSAIGSNIGRWLRLSPKSVRILLGCGAQMLKYASPPMAQAWCQVMLDTRGGVRLSEQIQNDLLLRATGGVCV